MRGELDGLHAGAARDVHVEGRDLLGNARPNAHLATGVRPVPGLARVAEDRLIDLFGVDGRAPHRLSRGERPELDRRHLGERAEEPPDRGPRALEDHRRLHASSLASGRVTPPAPGRDPLVRDGHPGALHGILARRAEARQDRVQAGAAVDRLAGWALRVLDRHARGREPRPHRGELVGALGARVEEVRP